MTLKSVIKHYEEMVDEKLCEYQECLAVYDMEAAIDCAECAEEHEQLVEWLKQLKEVHEIIKVYKNTPIEVMDGSDAFTEICKVVEE